MWVADSDSATEKRSRPVLDVLHLLELTDEVGPHLPKSVSKRLCKPKLGEITQAGSLEGVGHIAEVPVRVLAGRWKQPYCQLTVERSDAIGGQLRLFLVLDLL